MRKLIRELGIEVARKLGYDPSDVERIEIERDVVRVYAYTATDQSAQNNHPRIETFTHHFYDDAAVAA